MRRGGEGGGGEVREEGEAAEEEVVVKGGAAQWAGRKISGMLRPLSGRVRAATAKISSIVRPTRTRIQNFLSAQTWWAQLRGLDLRSLAITIATLCCTWLVWKVIEEPADCSLLPAVRPFDACGFSDGQLKEILQQPHGFTRGSPRYFYLGQWMHYITLSYRLSMWRPNPKVDDLSIPPCILVSVQGSVPCPSSPCLLPFFLRPSTSDVMVLRVLFEFSPSPFQMLLRESERERERRPNSSSSSTRGSSTTRGSRGNSGGSSSGEGEEGRRFRCIVDGGANIGVTTAALAIMFPSARIFAVEPSEENFRLLRLNTFNYPNVVPLRAALWGNSRDNLTVHSDPRKQGFWALMTSPAGSLGGVKTFGSVPALSVPRILEMFALPSVDFLKLDIESAEKEVFSGDKGEGSASTAWVGDLKLAMIATHDRLRGGTESAVRRAFNLSKFQLEFGPSHYVFRNREVYREELLELSGATGFQAQEPEE